MNWCDRLLTQDSPERDLEGRVSLPKRIDALIKEQAQAWEGLRLGLTGLAAAETETFNVLESRVLAQHNAQRIVSTSAKVDAETIGERACFLCPENMPDEERGIDFLGRYAILCNPFPVLPAHLVIAAQEHRPQRITGQFADMLALAEALGSGYVVLYNGPACGASAPDHLHFQAAKKDGLPIVEELTGEGRNRQSRMWDDGWVRGWSIEGYRVNFVAAESAVADALEVWFERLMKALGRVAPVSEPEPMVNLMAEFTAERNYRLIIFPRERHRPTAFFAEGDEKLTISPAAIDLGGVLVVPVEADFRRLKAEMIENIYREVTLAPTSFDRLIAAMDKI